VNKWRWSVAGALTLVAVLVLAGWSAGALQGRPQQPTLLPEAEAIRLGVQEAKQFGLQGEPTAVSTRLMTLGEFVRLNGGEILAGGPQLGLDPKMQVWVVAMRGSVDLRGKVPGTPMNSRYDNIFLALNAQTGKKVMGPGTRNPGVPLPIPVP
jgi:hypothetical protein